MNGIELEKNFNPHDFEDRIYERWETEGHFKPSPDAKKNTFTIVIPPPNVTGVLHLGHGLNNAMQDIVVRYHRMIGKAVLWVPGTDHAGIATQNVVERLLKKEGTSRRELGREAFIEKTWQVKSDHHKIISKQLRKIGASVDWSRERFTLDAGLSQAVREVFVTLYERGLVYRGNYLVNWCTSCGTALADDEVDREDTTGFMYHIDYKTEDGGTIEIATTRPETLLGDTAVAVHPEDERYKKLIGKRVQLPLTNRTIPIVADTYVDREFGTGMVKITPAHDPNDWELAKRHNLEIISILNPDGTLNDAVPQKYRGMKIADARTAVIADLTQAGLFKGEEKITHAVGHCYRCHTTVEPLLSEQWFVKMKPLAEKALSAWKRGEIVFYPKKWENTYSHWMENIRDWCISRQLWWGHRIPVWYCSCGEVIVSRTDPETCSKCGGKITQAMQDLDVLDTWFSSWVWPFSTLGWPKKTDDCARFYPTNALVTAYDIIFFWVARMIMAGLEFTGQVPFRDIFLHGLVRDKHGRKMSKSLGNGIDPLEIINESGSDALKFTLAFLCAQGQDVLVDKESFKLGSRFANKIWNASRYILGNLEGRTLIAINPAADADKGETNGLTELDRWIYTKLNAAAAKVRTALEGFRYNEGAQTIYEFFWNDFCDWYVEATKLSFKNPTDNDLTLQASSVKSTEYEKNRAISVLLNILEESLRLLHPYLPFVTEEIYQKLPLAELAKNRSYCGGNSYCGMLISAPYPEVQNERENPAVAERFAVLQDLIRSIRALRAECGVSPDTKLIVALILTPHSPAQVCREKTDLICLLAGLLRVDFTESKPHNAIGAVGSGYEAFVLIGEGIDAGQLTARFEKEIADEKAFAAKLQVKLSGKFAENAPAEVVAAEREKLANVLHRIEKLTSYIQGLHL